MRDNNKFDQANNARRLARKVLKPGAVQRINDKRAKLKARAEKREKDE